MKETEVDSVYFRWDDSVASISI